MTPTSFRLLVLCSVVLGLVGGCLDCLFPSLLPSSLTTAFENEPPPALLSDSPALALALLVPFALVLLVSTIGLLFFWRWSRTIALFSTVAGFGIYPLFGQTLSSGWANSLLEASFTTWGAVLALAYFSPLSQRFVSQPNGR